MEEELKRAKNHAYRLLSYRWYTRKEMEDNLLQKGYQQEIIVKTIRHLEENKYINDQRFTENWLESRAQRKLLGSRRLKQELKERGIDDNLIREKLEGNFPQEKELELAVNAARKKAALSANLDKEKFNRRMIAFLQRKGFGYEIIKQALSQLEEEGRGF